MVRQRIQGKDPNDYTQHLRQYLQVKGGDLVIRRTGPLEEGSPFDLSLLQIAEAVDASILLDCLISPSLFSRFPLSAKERLGDRLLGVLTIPADQALFATIKPFRSPGYSIMAQG